MAPLPIALLLGAVAVGLRLLASRRSGADREKLADSSLLERYVRLPAHALPPVRLALLGAGVVAIALASGSGGTEARRLDEGGAETILVLDASNSMLAGDVQPSRLEVQRQLAARLATQTQGRMGVVYFAGRAYVLSPLTTDMSAIEMLAEGVRPAAVGLGGSSLASGLTQAIDLLAGGEEGARKSIVVFSDGEETAGAPLGEAIGRARDAGIVIHSVGIGTELGGQIPLTREASLDPTMAARRRGGASVLQGPDGSPVITRLNAAPLRQMSLGTSGHYVDGSDGTDAIERELAQGGREPLTSTDDVAVAALLLLAFVSLWGEGFLLPRG
ncbi:MAG: VWA domain-containing protein [Gemmatimonadales bacterium]|nr:VWA domain-containing protein [Gemmatimonadales bacterium]MYK01507.1 VWA domain-containing protein [Candidatus Palauibacter ramosifaciens]